MAHSSTNCSCRVSSKRKIWDNWSTVLILRSPSHHELIKTAINFSFLFFGRLLAPGMLAVSSPTLASPFQLWFTCEKRGFDSSSCGFSCQTFHQFDRSLHSLHQWMCLRTLLLPAGSGTNLISFLSELREFNESSLARSYLWGIFRIYVSCFCAYFLSPLALGNSASEMS